MEFMSRGVRQVTGQPETQAMPTGGSRSKRANSKLMNGLSIIMLTAIGLLGVAVVTYLVFGGTKPENSYIAKNNFQAVFLNGGQVYFGKIRNLNGKYVTMDNIYYLRVNQQVQNQAASSTAGNQEISLAKLGCELHGPQDIMVINRDQVTFWENLKDDGQVVNAITDFVKKNPNGQKCDSAAANSTTPTTPTTTTPPTTTPKK